MGKLRTITVSDFKTKHQLTEKEQTIITNWICQGLIPGCYKSQYTGEWCIPEDALPPYKTTCKQGGDYYTSIMKACCQHKRPCFQLYKISENEFAGYVKQLVDAKLIYVEEIDGIDYYRATIMAQQVYNTKGIKIFKNFVLEVIEAVSKGATSALT